MKHLKEILDEPEYERTKKTDMPEWIDPMLATLTHDRFDDPDWIYERKLDGERCIVYCDAEQRIKMMSRNKKELNVRYPEIIDALKKLNRADYILDGEIVAFDGQVSDFSKLQKRMHLNDDEAIRKSDVAVYYYVFDILYLEGRDVRDLSLKERKKTLKSCFDFESPLFYTDHVKEEGKKHLREACKKGREGLIAKDYHSHYVSARSRKWLKFKCENKQEFVIVGYTEPQGERIGFGALLIGYYENEELRYAGKVGTGFTDDMLDALSRRFRELETQQSPLANPEEVESDRVHWLKPRLVGEVSFTEWTDDRRLRHPSFEGMRDDKNPSDVVNEEKRRRQNDDE